MIEGYCDDRFLEAKTLFEKNINNGFELGGAVSVELKGKKIIDLWGG